jgi:hypothetical protein
VVVTVIVVGGDLILADGEVELVVVAEVVGVLMVAVVAGASVVGVGGGLMEVAVAAEVVVDMEEYQKGTWTIFLSRSKILATWSLLRRTFTLRVLQLQQCQNKT